MTAVLPTARVIESALDYNGLDLLTTAVLVVDAAGRICFVNQAAELLLDASRRHLIGQPAHHLFVDELLFDQLLQAGRAADLGEQRQLAELR